jgi:flavin reductase (DIM6/NTAB) family NADH-FMN oxidoreductase RutF
MPAPSHFAPVALHQASRLINHGPTVLVTSAHGGRANVMAAAWSMPVEFTPPRIAVVIDKKTYTRELIAASGAFGICLPGAALAALTFAVGSTSGYDEDKIARHGIQTRPGPVLGMPVIEQGCAAWLGGCAEFCVNGQSTAGVSRPVRKHNEHQETRRTRRTAVWPAGQLQEA